MSARADAEKINLYCFYNPQQSNQRSITSNSNSGASVMEDTSKKERLAELNRERVNRHREKVKGNGLVRVEVHIKPEFRTLLRAYVKGMK